MKKLMLFLAFSMMLHPQEIRFNRIYVKNKIVAETLQVKEVLPKQTQDSVSFRKVLIWDKLIATGTNRTSTVWLKDISFTLPLAGVIGIEGDLNIWQTLNGEIRNAFTGTLLFLNPIKRLVNVAGKWDKWDTIPNFRDIRSYASGLYTRQASANVNLNANDAIFQLINPIVSGIDVVLPTGLNVKPGKRFIIKNNADIFSSNFIRIRYGANNYIDAIYPQSIKEYVWNGSVWQSADITGLENIAIGNYATSYNYGIAIGPGSFAKTYGVALGNSSYTSNNGITIGSNSGASLDVSGVGNVIIGASAGNNLTTGTNNIIIGREAGSDMNYSPSTGSYNVLIGYNAWTPSTNTSYFLNIGGLIFGTNLSINYNTISTGKVGIRTTTPTDNLDVNGTFRSRGSIHLPVKTVNANYTATNEDFVILGSSTTPITITLPVVSGRVYVVKKVSTGDVVVAPASGTIDGSPSITLTLLNSSIVAICDGTNYYIIAQK